MIDKFSILNEAKYFSSGIFQNYLVFIPAIKHIKYFHGTTQIYSWKSNEMSEESIENITKPDGIFAPTFVDHHSLPGVNFNGHCLIKSNISILKNIINLYISYTLGPLLSNFNTDFTLSNCLFGSGKLTKTSGLDKYKYNNYGIEFDSRGEYSLPDGSAGENIITFGVDTSYLCILILNEKIS